MLKSPFFVNRYDNPKYFCPRTEINDLVLSKLNAGENLQIVSPNGLGKTSLIKHIIYQMDHTIGYNHIYLDLFKYFAQNELYIGFISSILEAYSQKSQKKITKLKESIFPENSLNDISLIDLSEEELEKIFVRLVSFLGSQKKSTIVVLDNYQYIQQFLNNATKKSFLETLINKNNIQIILAGTENQVAVDRFNKIVLEKIPENIYKRFISDLFEEAGREITKKSLSHIYNWAEGETAAIQILCSRLWMCTDKKIKSSIVNEAIDDILLENKSYLLIIKNLLSSYQWRLLKAIAKEGLANQVTSSSFMGKYSLNAPSSVKTALTALIEKDLILRVGSSYKINNIILGKGLAFE